MRQDEREEVIKMGTWNVLTLLKVGKLENAKREMMKNRLDILGMCEVRWGGNGELESDGYRLYYSGQQVNGEYGVGVMVSPRMTKMVERVAYVDERIMMIRLKGKARDLVVVMVYMPTSNHQDEEIEECYNKIQEVIDKEKRGACTVVMGDWNAVVGEGAEGKVVGKYGLGVRNERGGRLINFCEENSLVIGNTLFKNHKRRRYTWTSRMSNGRYQLDYIMVQDRYRNCLKSAKSYPGADIDSDHNLVVAEIRIGLKRVRRGKAVVKFNVEQLTEENKRKELQDKYVIRRRMKGTVIESDEWWKEIKEDIAEVAKEVVGRKRTRRIKKEWITMDMIRKMDERRRWKNIRTEEGKKMYRKLNNELRRETDSARTLWWAKQCEAIEAMDREGRAEEMYKRVKGLTFSKKSNKTCWEIEREDGVIVTEREEVLKRWKGYIEELYEADKRPESIEVGEEAEVREEEKGYSIMQSEVEKAMKEMRNRKACGVDEIPSELWKGLEDYGIRDITSLCNMIYESGVWPNDFLTTIMVPLEKKRNARKCKDYRTISLISHAAKVLLRILNRRLQGRMDENVEEEQFGFRKGRGTREAIGVVRAIGERYMERQRNVYIAFVDLEKAFDRVVWGKLMSSLKEKGVAWKERRLIKNLYLNQAVRIRIGGEVAEKSRVGRGVRQGCCMSPTLFNIYLEDIIKRGLKRQSGVNIGGRRIQCIRFADDMALLAESEKMLRGMLFNLDGVMGEYGMRINVEKTKCMVIGREHKNIDVKIKGHRVEQVESFKYLGCLLTEDMRCTKEIKVRIAMAKEAFSKHRQLLCSKLDLKLRKRLAKCFVWSVALYGAETWTMRKEDERRIEALEMWIWRRMEKISWVEKVRNEDVLKRIGEDRSMMKTVKRRKGRWLGHWIRQTCLLREVLEGAIKGRRAKGRRRYTLVDDIRNGRSYVSMKRLIEDREGWRTACRDLP